VIRVRDDGVGIERDMLEMIFEPFRQGEGNPLTSDGLGIGLFLTRKLVEAHGGSITAESQGAMQGSQFTVRLPLALHALEATPARAEPRAAEVPPDFRVLVVDDNRDAAETIASLLKLKGGFVATCAYTGMEARELHRSFRPDAVVLDIGLPDVSGFDVAAALRNEEGFEGPIIAVTGFGQKEDVQRGAEAGIDHHFIKPVSIDALIGVAVARRPTPPA
jgi:CheY-like chemotaxis protein